MARERVFTPLRRNVLRSRISRAEVGSGLAVLSTLMLTGVWVVSTRDAFDPGDRDIRTEVLVASSVEDTLWRAPLKRWAEPGALTASAPIDLGPLSAEVLSEGWQLDGRVETFEPDDLYEKINGAAEQYIAFGFEKLTYLTLENGGTFLTVELYDQGDLSNVLGIFSAQRDQSRRVEARDGIFFYRTPVGAIGGAGRLYFKISGSVESAAVTAWTDRILGELTRLPDGAATVPAPYRILVDRLNVGFDRLAYIRSDAFQYDFLSNFWFGTTGPKAESRWYLHEADSAGLAGDLLERFLEEQAFEYEDLDISDRARIMKHRYLGTYFSVARRGRYLLGVEGAASETEVRRNHRALEEALADGQEETTAG